MSDAEKATNEAAAAATNVAEQQETAVPMAADDQAEKVAQAAQEVPPAAPPAPAPASIPAAPTQSLATAAAGPNATPAPAKPAETSNKEDPPKPSQPPPQNAGAAGTVVPDTAGDDGNDFEKMTVKQALKKLGVTADGLTSDEAKKRLEQYGPNKMEEKKKNKLWAFIGFMWNPLSWAMEVAAIIAIALLDYADFALIIALLLLNACVGYYEESSADDAIGALMASLAPMAKILRDGKISSEDAASLVPGDIILIRLGDVVPADIKILGEDETEFCLIDQAALTGESLPVKRFPGQVAYSGSTVKQGESKALVYGTGSNTFFGKAAQLIGETESTGHLQQVLTMIGGVCLFTIAFWMIIELGVQFGARNHECVGGAGGCPTLENMLVVIVGGIPIAMPTVLSVTLALGAYKLAQHGAIVSRLTAIEELAGMNMLCSDKTGTLTLNKLSVDKPNLHPGPGFTAEDILKYGALSAKTENNEPIDVCVDAAYDGRNGLWEEHTCTKYTPFNPVDKKTVAFIKHNATGRIFRAAKGAPQVVLKLAHNFPEIKDDMEAKILEYANRGYRALGVGLAEGDGTDGQTKWQFVGLIPIFDPPRHDTKETIARCIELGIGVKMITGDQLPIGKETARQLGMGTNMHTTEVFNHPNTLIEGAITLDDLIEQADGFAEVFPEHKFEIVKRLQDKGYMTGMTGDGVNDAPALKRADIGIAVADATDAARAAADIVLTEPGLSVIVEAVNNSRKIFQRMKNYAIYTISTTYRICFTFGLLTVIYNWYFPTILIVLLAVFNDGAMIALSKDRVTPSPNPNAWFLKRIFMTGLVYGLYLTLSSWALFYVASHTNFFQDHFSGLFNLQYGEATNYCMNLPMDGFAAGAPACTSQYLPYNTTLGNTPGLAMPGSISAIYPTQFPNCAPNTPSALQQCIAEVWWTRQSRLRTLIFAHLSISGQALIFVTRSQGWSFLDRPGNLLFAAFFVAQLANCLIAGFGFNGYEFPKYSVSDCFFCERYDGTAPLANTESIYTASAIGCGWYVLVAWIWAAIWYVGLDPIKFVMHYVLEGHVPSLFNSNPAVMRANGTIVPADPGSRASRAGYAGSRASMAGGRSTLTSGRPRQSQVVRGSVM